MRRAVIFPMRNMSTILYYWAIPDRLLALPSVIFTMKSVLCNFILNDRNETVGFWPGSAACPLRERGCFMELLQRSRRLRGSEALRRMVRETRADASSLIYPMFVCEGSGIKEEIPSMTDQYRWSLDRFPEKLEELQEAGVNSFMLFGIPAEKDEVASGAYAEDGIVQRAVRLAKERYPEMYCITDVCLCEYTSHGHC